MKSQPAVTAEKSGQENVGKSSPAESSSSSFCPDFSASNPLLNRRRFLADTGIGLGAIALTHLLARQGLLAANLAGKESIRPLINPGSPYASREPHFKPKAKNVLLIFCSGACSQLDTFDYKPELIRHHGQPMPGQEKLITFQGEQGALTRARGNSGRAARAAR